MVGDHRRGAMRGDRKRQICQLLEQLPVAGLEAVQSLLCTELGYHRAHEVLPCPVAPEWTYGS